MGKPIAGKNKYPFGIESPFIITVAKIDSSEKIEDVRISKQRNSTCYDLIGLDKKEYGFMVLTYKDTNGKDLDVSKTDEELLLDIADRSFFIKVYDSEGEEALGFVTKFLRNGVNTSVGRFIDYKSISFKPKKKVEGLKLKKSPTPIGIVDNIAVKFETDVILTPEDAEDYNLVISDNTENVNATISGTKLVINALQGSNEKSSVTVKDEVSEIELKTEFDVYTAVISMELDKSVDKILLSQESVQAKIVVNPSDAKYDIVVKEASDIVTTSLKGLNLTIKPVKAGKGQIVLLDKKFGNTKIIPIEVIQTATSIELTSDVPPSIEYNEGNGNFSDTIIIEPSNAVYELYNTTESKDLKVELTGTNIKVTPLKPSVSGIVSIADKKSSNTLKFPINFIDHPKPEEEEEATE